MYIYIFLGQHFSALLLCMSRVTFRLQSDAFLCFSFFSLLFLSLPSAANGIPNFGILVFYTDCLCGEGKGEKRTCIEIHLTKWKFGISGARGV